ncbi:MAG TPA: ABC transporter permease [Chloroflexota bacterium]|nr:ABC transporter permease [Chloroflexota bacterium]
MTTYVVRRLIFSVFVLWGALTVVFLAVRAVPGDPAQMMMGPNATAAEIDALREKLGLNRPLVVQYAAYMVQTIRLDLGESLRLAQPVVALVAERLPTTGKLALTAILIAVAVSFPLGMAAAIRPGGLLDGVVSVVSLLGQSVPGFWLGIMFILIFARSLRLLPSAGDESLAHLILPSITVALPLVGVLTRLVRSGLLDVLDEDYVRTARAKGLTPRAVMWRHAIRNMLIPVITVVGLQIGHLLGGAVITETVFAWPGVGTLLVDAITNRDYPLVQASILFITALFVTINFLVDLSYGALDPRIRLQ